MLWPLPDKLNIVVRVKSVKIV